jgi:ribosomal-protein-alanine N-acetyltransferase
MCEDDLNDVSELAILANPFATKEKYCAHITEELRENPDLSFVVIENGKVIGYAQAEIQNDNAMLEDIAVAKEYQRKGIGNRLLSKESDALKRKRVKTISAEVHYKCASAIPFYYENGFRISGFVKDRFGIGHDAIILRLALQ